MQNPTGTACAAAPRFLKTLARAGSLRAASGRFLKTLGQKNSSCRELVPVALHFLLPGASGLFFGALGRGAARLLALAGGRAACVSVRVAFAGTGTHAAQEGGRRGGPAADMQTAPKVAAYEAFAGRLRGDLAAIEARQREAEASAAAYRELAQSAAERQAHAGAAAGACVRECHFLLRAGAPPGQGGGPARACRRRRGGLMRRWRWRCGGARTHAPSRCPAGCEAARADSPLLIGSSLFARPFASSAA